jgi:hypothetical protein
MQEKQEMQLPSHPAALGPGSRPQTLRSILPEPLYLLPLWVQVRALSE